MYTEARKIHLIEAVLKVTDNVVLSQLESVLQDLSKQKALPKPFSAHEFSGVWSKADADLMEKAIQEGCEQ
jgi:mRNA-degrading endonuclease YafQ of YafQ-DinJ toxin-antitoxin module